MSLKFALLGLLAHTPRHGYDLKSNFEATFSQMRSLNAGQIYTTLARLTAEGLVSNETVAQSQAPAKKVYCLTDSGRSLLEEWLTRPVEDHFEQVRSEFFIKLMVQALVAGQSDASAQQTMIERQRQQLFQSLSDTRRQRLQLSLVLAPGASDPRSSDEQELSEMRLLLLEGAILHLEADLAWLDLIEQRLQRLADLRHLPTE